MARAVGIDLGTTNSVVAVLEGGEPTVIANAEGARTTPSVVAFSKTGEVLVGEIAKRQAVTNVDRTITSVKRHMGTDWSSAIDDKKYTAQEISRARARQAQARRRGVPGRARHRRRHHRPGVLQRRRAPGHQGRRRRSPASTCCASSTSPPRPRWPTAWSRGKEDELILVFDLGGGTFDVSLLEVGKDEDGFSTIQVRATSGDNRLGGDDWDQRIVEHLITEVKNSTGVDLSKDKIAAAASARGGGAGQEGALVRDEHQHLAAVPVDERERPGPPGQQAHARAVPADDAGPARAHQGAVPRRSSATPGIKLSRHRPRRARRRLDPHARRHRGRQGADRRQGAQQGRQPGRGRRRRRRAAGRRHEGRAQGRPAHRRHPAEPRHRDQGRRDDQAHRAQHGHPDQALARSSPPPRTTSRPC